MNYIYVTMLAFFVTVTGVHAQTNSETLTSRNWEVKSSYMQLRDKLLSFYHPDSTDNINDYKGMEFSFRSNGTYTVKNGSTSVTGEWSFVDNGDSLRLDGQTQHFVRVNENNFTLSVHSLQFADLDANLDTAFTYLEFGAKSGGVTGISTGVEKATLAAYPNPTRNVIKVDLTEDHHQLSFLNTSGKVVKSIKTERKKKTIEVDLHELPTGVYILEALGKTGKRIAFTRIVKE